MKVKVYKDANGKPEIYENITFFSVDNSKYNRCFISMCSKNPAIVIDMKDIDIITIDEYEEL